MSLQQIWDNVSLESLIPSGQYGATETGAGVDVREYTGFAEIIIDAGAVSTGDTLDVKIQESADDGATDAYTDVAGAAFTQATDAGALIEGIGVDMDARERYIRAVGTLTGGTPQVAFSVHLVGLKKYR